MEGQERFFRLLLQCQGEVGAFGRSLVRDVFLRGALRAAGEVKQLLVYRYEHLRRGDSGAG
jgi:hypothetical protein